jgi:hypothetical protein
VLTIAANRNRVRRLSAGCGLLVAAHARRPTTTNGADAAGRPIRRTVIRAGSMEQLHGTGRPCAAGSRPIRRRPGTAAVRPRRRWRRSGDRGRMAGGCSCRPARAPEFQVHVEERVDLRPTFGHVRPVADRVLGSLVSSCGDQPVTGLREIEFAHGSKCIGRRVGGGRRRLCHDWPPPWNRSNHHRR